MSPADKAALASFVARPEWARIRPLLEQLSPGVTAKLDGIVREIRRDIWKDFSNG